MLLSPEEEAKAKQRFIVINAVRMSGVLLILLGIAIAHGVIGLPAMAGYVFAGLGMIEVFVIPQVLARKWRSNNR